MCYYLLEDKYIYSIVKLVGCSLLTRKQNITLSLRQVANPPATLPVTLYCTLVWTKDVSTSKTNESRLYFVDYV